ncbi:hypothetical protein B0J14DRAFT_571616 [Halenospora varia]|nr:hypothetical protein B0J14DRAFT_571616 [Halenospora varia]
MPTRSLSNNSTAVAPGSVHKFPSLDQARVAYTPTGSPPTRPTNRPNSLTPSVIEVMDEAFSKRDSHGDTIGPLEVGSTRFSGAAGVRSPPPVGGYRNLHSRLTDEERCQVPPQPYRPGHQRNFTEPTVPPQGAFSDRSITPEPLRIVKRSVSDAKAHNGHQSSFKIEDFAGLYENGKQRFDDPDESDEEKKAKLREEAFNTLEGNPPARRQIASSIYSRTMSGVPGYNQQGQSSRHAERTIHEERARHTSHGSEEIGRAEQLAAEIDEDLRNHRDDSEDPEDHDNLYDA